MPVSGATDSVDDFEDCHVLSGGDFTGDGST
jgi:hypothetical protein